MVLNPAALIWSSMSCQLRAQSPCGANAFVSKPNQATPVNRTSRPFASTTFPPTVWRGTLMAVFAAAVGGGGAAAVGTGKGVAVLQGAGCCALPCGALPCGALPCGALPCGALPCGALPCGALPCGALPCGALPCGALPCAA